MKNIWIVTVNVAFFGNDHDEFGNSWEDHESHLVGVYDGFDEAKQAIIEDINDICRDANIDLSNGECEMHSSSDYYNDYFAIKRFQHMFPDGDMRPSFIREYRIYPKIV